jgi:hypothetical protein
MAEFNKDAAEVFGPAGEEGKRRAMDKNMPIIIAICVGWYLLKKTGRR